MRPILIENRFTRNLTFLALSLFIPLFITRGIGEFDFWWWMAGNIAILLTMTAALDRGWRDEISSDLRERVIQKIGIGVLSALGLYVVFYTGNTVSRMLFTFAGSGIENVYAFKENVPLVRMALLMVCVIGPGEELFWRGFLQRRLQVEKGPFQGFLLATLLYTAVHLVSGNIMLVIAAAICGVFWGFLYLRAGSLLLNVISHTVWDVAIFLLFPVSG